MRKIFKVTALVATIFTFGMCKNNGIPVESNWTVEYIYTNGIETPVPDDHNATIAFLKDSKIAGDTGCNRFFGDFKAKGNSLVFENMGSTRMMCPQMQFETAYMQTLNNTASYIISNGKMILKDNGGNIIASLKKIEPVSAEN